MKILYIVSRFPYPLEKGDKLRAYHQIKGLSENNEVFLYALSDKDIKPEEIAHLKQFCKEVKVFRLTKFRIFLNLLRTTFGRIPWQVGYFYSHKAQKSIDAIIADYKPEHIFCQLIRTAEYAKKHKSIPKTLDYMDVFSKGIERRLPTIRYYFKPLYNAELKRLIKYEASIFNYFDNKIIISEQDRDLIAHPDKNKISVISNGVDLEYFKAVPLRKEYDIIFNGNMNYPPNIESAEYLVNTIIPIVLKKYPRIKVLISGANPSPKVKALASLHVTVTGWVEDIRENFGKSKMLVAPMFMSIGLQNKLLEAMALKIPCITSTLANNALQAVNGESIVIANTAEEYAMNIHDLIYYEDKAKMIGLNGHNFVVENYSWEAENNKLEQIIRNTKMDKSLSIVFMGTPEFAVASLDALVNSRHRVVAVVTAPDRPTGRGLKLQQSAVKEYANKNRLEVLQPEKLKDESFINKLKKLNPDLIIVVAFRMLPEVVWRLPKMGTINLHASVLPNYRGAAPINWAIINGEKTTGVTTFYINEQIDRGNIICWKNIDIEENDNAGALHDKLMKAGAILLVDTLDSLVADNFIPIAQGAYSDDNLKPAPKIFKQDCRINWNKLAEEVRNFIRGLSPYPAAWTEIVNKEGKKLGMKILSSTVNRDIVIAPGKLLVKDGVHIYIGCKDAAVEITELQLEGKKTMPVADFLRGFKLNEADWDIVI